MSFDSIKLEKGMYTNGFSKTLEELDPTENYTGTELANLDAFERQLKRFDIKVCGKNSDTIEKFFLNSDSAVLFPEYMKRAVESGMESTNLVNSMVATVTKIDNNDYRTIVSETEDTADNVTSEGEFLPKTTIKLQNSLVEMKKRGRVITSSYEALRLKRLDLFAVTLKQIGAEIARKQLEDAVEVIVDGDGNNNAASFVEPISTAGITYNDLIAFWADFAPHQLNTIIANTSTIRKIMALNEMKDANAGLNFQGTGKMITPLGADLIPSSWVIDDILVGIDKTCALEMVQVGDVINGYDRLIDCQLERIVVSSTVGFAKIFPNACKVMEIA